MGGIREPGTAQMTVEFGLLYTEAPSPSVSINPGGGRGDPELWTTMFVDNPKSPSSCRVRLATDPANWLTRPGSLRLGWSRVSRAETSRPNSSMRLSWAAQGEEW